MTLRPPLTGGRFLIKTECLTRVAKDSAMEKYAHSLTKHEQEALDKLSAIDISEVSSSALACWLARMLKDRGISCMSIMHLPNNHKSSALFNVTGNIQQEGNQNQIAAGMIFTLLDCICNTQEIDKHALIMSLIANLPDGCDIDGCNL